MRKLALMLLFLAASGIPDPGLALDGRLHMEGADLVLSLDDGRVLKREDLIGIRLKLPGPAGVAEARIDSVVMDETAVGGRVPLFGLSLHQGDKPPQDVCLPDPKGRRLALAMANGHGGFAFTCTSGAEGKCILMGYRPWDDREGVPMRDLHRACTHMLRADYGGDDHPTTRDGTLVDIFDRFGIQTSAHNDRLTFEAAWGPDGALCVAHPRIPENMTLSTLAERYPRLRGRLGPDACTEDAMRHEARALLFNRSAGAP
ncbi:ADYC domain-containing protein [Microvirga rosea]|uniref:ADYC domain-containing protein n=1 Tax=Microvirga rosea TaxID=2715425 RepID=UPI001D0AECA8|nr:ADYC domain-containing protein [Microvirga rosea]MCB8820012.1 hypothetical protein [Microvirga rosea]